MIADWYIVSAWFTARDCDVTNDTERDTFHTNIHSLEMLHLLEVLRFSSPLNTFIKHPRRLRSIYIQLFHFTRNKVQYTLPEIERNTARNSKRWCNPFIKDAIYSGSTSMPEPVGCGLEIHAHLAKVTRARRSAARTTSRGRTQSAPRAAWLAKDPSARGSFETLQLHV